MPKLSCPRLDGGRCKSTSYLSVFLLPYVCDVMETSHFGMLNVVSGQPSVRSPRKHQLRLQLNAKLHMIYYICHLAGELAHSVVCNKMQPRWWFSSVFTCGLLRRQYPVVGKGFSKGPATSNLLSVVASRDTNPILPDSRSEADGIIELARYAVMYEW